ncbi:NAD(P)-dependent dehydrogenase (short-subunit alcohol dehydrogenase family) [Nonomuraea thailandensis]|uniref:NAD(P)-dependent dehydrogenase (Short-subunit alcohol dehydrogenase family) n=1 Tax=Nonomuraea thailandensis TaxID=1188745 RepID=A0A9X2GDP1_9ACTN|nr:glucose 1-dehydrogenase [Nonomuraea thailandensis]MCP2356927.1 NAD(P)-dependent dehydrogenase (short-subunit alcohol dehydrogenase family) [Nonomuraea thailandensis]
MSSDKKIAVITGGATGIGKETAKLLIADGVHVVVSGRREDVGKQAVVELTKDGGSASFVAADMDSPQSITALFDSVLSEYGRLDYAVNNAGLAHETSAIADADPVKFQEMLSTNVMGLFLCLQREINEMLAGGRGGAIVNLASIAGLNGIPWSGPYAATKHAVVGLTKTAGLEYSSQGVRVNAVAPGAIKTDIIARAISLGQYDEETITAMHPIGRMGRPEEIAEGIHWLLSDKASFVAGAILNIDGGFQAK